MFENRQESGSCLAKALQKYKNYPNAVVIGLPRGGVVTAYEIAKELNLPLDITCPRKIGAPYEPELAIGAVTETGICIFNDLLIKQLDVSQEYLSRKIVEKQGEAQHRLSIYRKSLPPRDIKGKLVIIVDDGLATGATMEAGLSFLKEEHAAKIIVAIPVSSLGTLNSIKEHIDEMVCLNTPDSFQSIRQHYKDFSQTTDEEVILLLNDILLASSRRENSH